MVRGNDLQRRRPASSRVKSSRGNTAVRRRKRKSDRSRRACIFTLAFVVVFVPLGWIANRLLRSSGNDDAGTSRGARYLQDWMPKQAHSIAHYKLLTDQKSHEKEQRYESLYKKKFDTSYLGYDVHHCPPTPPHDYPKAWSAPEVLTNWNPNDVTTLLPNHRDVYHSLCIFDYQTQYETALAYRNAEKPFVIRNDPNVMSTVAKWDDNQGDYLHTVLGDAEEHRVERSPVNNFMWYRLRGNGKKKRERQDGYVKPLNDETEMTYGEWLEHALEKDGVALGDEVLIAKAKELRDRRLSVPNESAPEEDDHSIANGQGESEEEKEKKWWV